MKHPHRCRPLPALAALCLAVALAVSCSDGDPGAPGTVIDLTYFQHADSVIRNLRVAAGNTAEPADTRLLAFTSPGDDGYSGRASQYDVRYLYARDLPALGLPPDDGQALITNWDNGRQLSQEPDPVEGGKMAQLFLPRLSPGDTVWFAVVVKDEVGNESHISNVAGPIHVATIMVPVRPMAGDTAAGFGSVVAGLGDFNHDGHPDMLIGDPTNGRAALVLGTSIYGLVHYQLNAAGLPVDRSAPEFTAKTIISGDPADLFGAAVAALGNLNGDARADCAVGAPAADRGSTVDAGAVFIQFGMTYPPAALSADSVSAIIRGDGPGDFFGLSIAGGADVNQDGRAEFIVGAPGAFSSGAAYVFKYDDVVTGDAAAANVIIKGEAAGDAFGQVVAAVGDINGDGVADLAVGAPSADLGSTVDAGAVYVFYGGANGVAEFRDLTSGSTVIDLASRSADITIRGTAAGRKFGKQIAAGGNLAEDAGTALDLAVAGGDTVYIFFGDAFAGSTASIEINDISASARLSTGTGSGFGTAIRGAVDFNRDGHHDLIVGAPGQDAVYVFQGPITSSSTPAITLAAPVAGTGFGDDIDLVGDMNLDYFPDLIIASPGAGQAYFAF